MVPAATTPMGTKMLDDFLIRAGLAGIGVAFAAAPLGCFVVWRRMAYFGDATSHAALLGVALALAFEGTDTLLGVLAHGALAIGLVAVSLLPNQRVDLSAYLFGEILAVTKTDLAIIWSGAVLSIALLVWRWQALLSSTLNPDLATASGVNPRREQLILTLALAVTVAVAIKVVGALLIAAMLIIPAAAARPFARTPEVMAMAACIIGMIAALGGLAASFTLDTPTGPSIVSVAAVLFVLSSGVAPLLKR